MGDSGVNLNLPKVKKEEFLVYDYERDLLCGYLNKKAGQTSTFSKGRLQKRWFVINVDIGPTENYSISYYHGPDDEEARQTLDLSNAHVSLSGGNTFTIHFDEEVALTIGADTKDILERWVDTLEKIITVANLRERMMRSKRSEGSGGDWRSQIREPNKSSVKANGTSARNEARGGDADGTVDIDDQQLNNIVNPFQVVQRSLPTLRLDIDINSIPPSSTQRRQFIEMFVSDICRSLHLETDMVEVTSVKPFPGMIWLTLVEFELFVPPPVLDQRYEALDDEEYHELLEEEARKIRRKYLMKLNEMVLDGKSSLYTGFITCKLDPSFTKHLLDKDDELANVEMFSSDPVVLDIMNRYRHVDISSRDIDTTHFKIYVSFENTVRPFMVPNPLVLTRRDCAVWPYEIKQALGLTGTMQELWIEPMALVPRDLPKYLTNPIVFEPSARLGGAVTINAARLKADLCYDVQCEDYRGEVLRSLSEEEVEQIKMTFDQYDQNGDGSVSKFELEELMRIRTEEKKAFIKAKFQEIANDPQTLASDIARAEEYRRQHFQHLDESQAMIIKMFDAADSNNDGVLSFTEFMLAEAWWLRCTLNPQKIHLF